MIDMKKSNRKDNTQLQVFTNNSRITERYKSPYEINSDRKNANVKFCISKYLTAVMLALPISKGTRTKYFNKIRFLLLEKYQSICNRLLSESPRNNKTTTYIRFSVKQSTWYFGFHLLYNVCSQVCAIILSKDRRICWSHKKEVIQKPPKVPLEKAIFKEKTHKFMKEIFSARSGVSYTKQLAFDGRKAYEHPNSKCKTPKEQYIKSSDLALLYSEVNSYRAFNELTDDIFLNHTFDEDDFAMIRAFKEDTLPKRKIATKEDYDMMHHIFTKCNLSMVEAAEISMQQK
ncbi:hypothetical protein RhiirA4_461475 [Rhizophagus irregularis]|uniref:Uncharacterized protein n=1 Tax=Rhizophagus irregularis TaxID=588596 RepID=A0A2I1GJ12_9GLOM|nr:hypothetical protein RhiirA4_461475 [Rhizophagus irregularis]